MLPLHFGLDPLSLFFLAPLAVQALAAALAQDRRPVPWITLLAAAAVLTAQDAFTLSLGYGTALTASRLADRKVAAWWPVPLAVVALVLAAFQPGEPAAFILILLAALPALAVTPAARTAAPLLLAGHYLLLRYVLIVLAPDAAPWWATVLLLLGVAVALGNALVAFTETALPRLLAAGRATGSGLLLIALGLALAGKAAAEPAVTGTALAALLLGLLTQALDRPLLALGAETIVNATGTAGLDWLGGLLRGMPRLGGLFLFGAAGWSMVPLGPGFPLVLLLLRATGATPDLGPRALLVVVAAVWGLGLSATIRVIGIGFLGRPRSLRAAAAEDGDRPVLLAMGILAAALLPLALCPGLILYAARPVLGLLAPAAPAAFVGYAPLRLLLLMLLPVAVVFVLRRRFGAKGEPDASPAWDGGLGKPPPWLPFGDPALQMSATGLSHNLARHLPDLSSAGTAAASWRSGAESRVARAMRTFAAVPLPAAGFVLLAVVLLGLLATR